MESDKNFLKRGEVDVIFFAPDNDSPHFNAEMKPISLSVFSSVMLQLSLTNTILEVHDPT